MQTIKTKDLVRGDYNVLLDSWYSPIEIIDRFEQLRSVYGTDVLMSTEFQRAREMFAAAVALLGAYELDQENKYWLQSNRQSSSPDVVSAKQLEDSVYGILLEQTMLEIVEFEEHFPGDDIVDFLLTTKLSPKKTYSEYTSIILMINRVLPFNLPDVQSRLLKIGVKPTIYIIGRPYDGKPGDFTISTVCPPTWLKPVQYNINKTASKYRLPKRVQLHRGMDKKISYTKGQLKPVNTYEIMGLDQKKVETKFKRS